MQIDGDSWGWRIETSIGRCWRNGWPVGVGRVRFRPGSRTRESSAQSGTRDVPAALKGAGQGQVVGVLESGTGGEALGDAGDADPLSGEALGEVDAGGLAFDVTAEGQDHFLNGFGGDAGFEAVDPEILGADSVEGAEASAENMVAAAEGVGFLEAQDVQGAFDDAQDAVGPGGVGTDGAGLGFGEGSTILAEADSFARGEEGVGEGAGDRRIRLDQMEGETFGGAGADPGQAAEGSAEGNDGFRE